MRYFFLNKCKTRGKIKNYGGSDKHIPNFHPSDVIIILKPKDPKKTKIQIDIKNFIKMNFDSNKQNPKIVSNNKLFLKIGTVLDLYNIYNFSDDKFEFIHAIKNKDDIINVLNAEKEIKNKMFPFYTEFYTYTMILDKFKIDIQKILQNKIKLDISYIEEIEKDYYKINVNLIHTARDQYVINYIKIMKKNINKKKNFREPTAYN